VAPFNEAFECVSPDQPITGVGRAGDFPYRASFAVLWDEINGERRIRVPKPWPDVNRMTSEISNDAAWAANPWVWVLAFKVVQP
jgi:hypothetical protein